MARCLESVCADAAPRPVSTAQDVLAKLTPRIKRRAFLTAVASSSIAASGGRAASAAPIDIFGSTESRRLAAVRVSDFRPHVGEWFRLRAESGHWRAARLVAAEDRCKQGGRRRPFSLLFQTGVDPMLTQQTYRVEHAQIGGFDLLLVPVGPQASVSRLEAVFG